jgi:hypothetical protein
MGFGKFLADILNLEPGPAAGVAHYANFRRERPGEINHLYGGRGVYFRRPQWPLARADHSAIRLDTSGAEPSLAIPSFPCGARGGRLDDLCLTEPGMRAIMAALTQTIGARHGEIHARQL